VEGEAGQDQFHVRRQCIPGSGPAMATVTKSLVLYHSETQHITWQKWQNFFLPTHIFSDSTGL